MLQPFEIHPHPRCLEELASWQDSLPSDTHASRLAAADAALCPEARAAIADAQSVKSLFIPALQLEVGLNWCSATFSRLQVVNSADIIINADVGNGARQPFAANPSCAFSGISGAAAHQSF